MPPKTFSDPLQNVVGLKANPETIDLETDNSANQQLGILTLHTHQSSKEMLTPITKVETGQNDKQNTLQEIKCSDSTLIRATPNQNSFEVQDGNANKSLHELNQCDENGIQI